MTEPAAGISDAAAAIEALFGYTVDVAKPALDRYAGRSAHALLPALDALRHTGAVLTALCASDTEAAIANQAVVVRQITEARNRLPQEPPPLPDAAPSPERAVHVLALLIQTSADCACRASTQLVHDPDYAWPDSRRAVVRNALGAAKLAADALAIALTSGDPARVRSELTAAHTFAQRALTGLGAPGGPDTLW